MSAAATDKGLPLRQYAKREGITLGAAYLRIWNERVSAFKDGREWRIVQPDESAPGSGDEDD